ncbi:MAG: MoaD/ThiS family protein [Myxococcota bacterium]
MIVRVLYFAGLRERRGVGEEELEVAPGTTLAELYATLFPPGEHGALPVAFTRNRAVSHGSTVIEAGDEISFLPPLGGG